MNTTDMETAPIDRRAYEAITEAIRAEASRLLASGEVATVIGYLPGRRPGTAGPAAATTAEQAQRLFFSPGCVNNLALYLSRTKKGMRRPGKTAVVLKGCDMKALATLISEHQLKREDVHIMAPACPGVFGANQDQSHDLSTASLAAKCRECNARAPEGADFTAGALAALPQLHPTEAARLQALEAMSSAERWNFWTQQFEKCIRCYACRQICPLCYCEQCLCDRNRPQAIDAAPSPASNLSWNLIRAMHLAGRCAGCAECERACPMDIPLNLLNRKMAQELHDLYGFEASVTPREKGPLNDYRQDDDQSFIK